jgi:hypothetical protein
VRDGDMVWRDNFVFLALLSSRSEETLSSSDLTQHAVCCVVYILVFGIIYIR